MIIIQLIVSTPSNYWEAQKIKRRARYLKWHLGYSGQKFLLFGLKYYPQGCFCEIINEISCLGKVYKSIVDNLENKKNSRVKGVSHMVQCKRIHPNAGNTGDVG